MVALKESVGLAPQSQPMAKLRGVSWLAQLCSLAINCKQYNKNRSLATILPVLLAAPKYAQKAKLVFFVEPKNGSKIQNEKCSVKVN